VGARQAWQADYRNALFSLFPYAPVFSLVLLVLPLLHLVRLPLLLARVRVLYRFLIAAGENAEADDDEAATGADSGVAEARRQTLVLQ